MEFANSFSIAACSVDTVRVPRGWGRERAISKNQKLALKLFSSIAFFVNRIKFNNLVAELVTIVITVPFRRNSQHKRPYTADSMN